MYFSHKPHKNTSRIYEEEDKDKEEGMGLSVPRREAKTGSSRRINKRKSSYYRACRLLLCVSLFVFIVKEFLINDDDENGVFAMGVRLIGSFASSSSSNWGRDATTTREEDKTMRVSADISSSSSSSSSSYEKEEEEELNNNNNNVDEEGEEATTAGVVGTARKGRRRSRSRSSSKAVSYTHLRAHET